MIATVVPTPPPAGRPYALCRSPAPKPEGVKSSGRAPLLRTPATSSRRRAKQVAKPSFAAAQVAVAVAFLGSVDARFVAALVVDVLVTLVVRARGAVPAYAGAGSPSPNSMIAAALATSAVRARRLVRGPLDVCIRVLSGMGTFDLYGDRTGRARVYL